MYFNQFVASECNARENSRIRSQIAEQLVERTSVSIISRSAEKISRNQKLLNEMEEFKLLQLSCQNVISRRNSSEIEELSNRYWNGIISNCQWSIMISKKFHAHIIDITSFAFFASSKHILIIIIIYIYVQRRRTPAHHRLRSTL